MFFVKHRKIFYAIIGALSALSVLALLLWGLRYSIEFTGGTLVEIAYDRERPDVHVVEAQLDALDLGGYSLRTAGDDGYILRTRDMSEEEYGNVRKALTVGDSVPRENRRATVGPTIGKELKNKALVAIAVVVLLIILYVAFAFRNVHKNEDNEDDPDAPGVSPWVYGVVSIFVLAHDILIPLGMFAVLGHFFGAEVDVLIVMALLTILGYSVNDTIVIFDRIRENLLKNKEEGIEEPFEETVGRSLSQTYARSINTSLTTLMVVISLLLFGGSTTMYFALTLVVGIFAGTYSSLALAAPLLVTIEAFQKKKREEESSRHNEK